MAAAWEVLHETGWDHPAWREAYSFAQLCLAAAYTNLSPSSPTGHSSNGSTWQPPITLHDKPISEIDHSAHRRSCTKEAADAMPPAQRAMQALDLASIMGAPPDFLGPVLAVTEPLALQQHQQSLAHQADINQPSYEAATLCSHAACASQQDEQCQHNGDSFEHQQNGSGVGNLASASMGHISPTPPKELPHLDPNRTIPRVRAADLTAAEFKRQYWKTDTPVIITGERQPCNTAHKLVYLVAMWAIHPWLFLTSPAASMQQTHQDSAAVP